MSCPEFMKVGKQFQSVLYYATYRYAARLTQRAERNAHAILTVVVVVIDSTSTSI